MRGGAITLPLVNGASEPGDGAVGLREDQTTSSAAREREARGTTYRRASAEELALLAGPVVAIATCWSRVLPP
jgi:hypothetical protein